MLGRGGFPNSKVIGGYDFGDDDSDPFPAAVHDPHGTSCAGIAAGDACDVGDYIGGVACGAKIYALKTKNSEGVIYNDNVIAAWDWCISHKNDNPSYPILVISTSIGGTRYTSPCDSSNVAYATAANNAVAAGITVVVSSDNDGSCNSITVPACLSNVISVGAVYDSNFGTYSFCIRADSCATKYPKSQCPSGWYCIDATMPDLVTSFSNTASFLDILAPSNMACTTDIVGSAGYSAGDYATDFGGTSAACPYVAGAAACIQSAAKYFTGHFLTAVRVREILRSSGDAVTDPRIAITKPRVNLGRAIESVQLNPCDYFSTGSGSSSWNYPLHAANHDSRTQVIYTASEIKYGGFIRGLAINVTGIAGQAMNNWTIRMKHTSMNSYDICELDSNDWTTVYSGNEPRGSTGWRTFNFSRPFKYNGIDNLMVDFSHNNSSSGSNGLCAYSAPGGNRCIYAGANSEYGDPLNWSGIEMPTVYCSENVPDIKLTLCGVWPGDFEPDGDIDICDLAAFADEWLYERLPTDIVPDGVVNFQDWAAFTEGWGGDLTGVSGFACQWLKNGVCQADMSPPTPTGDNIVNFRDFANLAANWEQ